MRRLTFATFIFLLMFTVAGHVSLSNADNGFLADEESDFISEEGPKAPSPSLPSKSGEKKKRHKKRVDPQKDLYWNVFKDETANGVITYIKDSLGNIYQLVPGGPKLPFGVSKGTIEAHGMRYGWEMAPLKNEVADKLKDRLSAGWEVFKLSKDIYDAYTGEENVKTAQNKIIASTIAAEVGIGLGKLASLVPGAGVGVALMAGWAGNNVKQAVIEALEAWDAKIEAVAAEKNWKSNDLRLARERLGLIKKAIEEGKYNEALRLNKGLNAFTEKRELENSDLIDLNTITWKLQSKIYAAMKEQRKHEKEDERKRLAERQRKVREWNAQWKKRQREKEKQESLFSVKLTASKSNVEPGEKVQVHIIISGGEPPFQISGDISEILYDRSDWIFDFEAPDEPGLYALEISATDANSLDRAAQLEILVAEKGREQEQEEKKQGKEGEKRKKEKQKSQDKEKNSKKQQKNNTGSGAMAGTFPKEPFNRLQMTYSVSGATSGTPKENHGFTVSRRYKGALSGSTLSVSVTTSEIWGDCNTSYGSFYSQLDMKVSVGNKSKTYSTPAPCNRGKKAKSYEVKSGKGSKTLSVPIPEGVSVDGSFSAILTFVNPRYGDRAVVVSGTFSGNNTPASGSLSRERRTDETGVKERLPRRRRKPRKTPPKPQKAPEQQRRLPADEPAQSDEGFLGGM